MPSFEEKGIAKAAARRAAREAKILANGTGKVANSAGKMIGNGLFRLIISNPYIGLSLLGILLAFVIYTVYSVNSSLDKLLYQYTHLVDTSQQNSKAQFDKKLHYIKVNADGTTSVVIGLKSEIDAQELQEAIEEAGGDDNSTADRHDYTGTAGSISDMCNLLSGAKEDLGIQSFNAPDNFSEKEKAILIASHSVGMTDASACGVIGNSNAEGGYGLQQHGTTTSLGRSTSNDELYIYNYEYDDVYNVLCALNVEDNRIGIGITQWTFRGYFNPDTAGSYTNYLKNKKDYWDTDKKSCIMYIELKMLQQSLGGIEQHASDEDTLPSYGESTASWTWEQLYGECGAVTDEEKKAARAAAWFLWLHERPGRYKSLGTASARARNALTALRSM